MRFRPGDHVIKQTGGNKMTIIEYTNNGVYCGWASDKYYEDFFQEKDLINVSDYKSSGLKTEKREELINNILNIY